LSELLWLNAHFLSIVVMRCVHFLALFVLSFCSSCGASTGKTGPYKSVPEESVKKEGDEAVSDGASSVDSLSDEGFAVDYVAVGSSCKRAAGVKGIATHHSSERACKQQLNNPEVNEAVCVVAPKGAPSHVCRRLRYVFPEVLWTPKAISQPRQVTMTLPEGYAPKDCTHTVVQEYAWTSSSMKDMQFTRNGHVSGG
jgi:hypothetical protein